MHVGRDEAEEIAGALADPELKTRLIRLSGIDDRQLAELYRHAACLCVPSTYEGFCLPVLEAQQLGCPVVCSNRSATPEIAGRGALTLIRRTLEALSMRLSGLWGIRNWRAVFARQVMKTVNYIHGRRRRKATRSFFKRGVEAPGA